MMWRLHRNVSINGSKKIAQSGQFTIPDSSNRQPSATKHTVEKMYAELNALFYEIVYILINHFLR